MKLFCLSLILTALLTSAPSSAGLSGSGEVNELSCPGKHFFIGLTGSEEVPGPGDDDGSGFIILKIKPHARKVCFFLSVDDIAEPTAAHIHEGREGVAGPIVVPLTPISGDVSHGCIEDLDPRLLRDIIRNPEEYYVNVHNADHPSGALRGQLDD